MNMPSELQAQLAALNGAFMGARDGGFQSAMPNLSPGVLAYLQAMQGEHEGSANGMVKSYATPDGNATLRQYANYAIENTSPDSQAVSFDPSRIDWSKSGIQFGTNTDVSNYVANYSPTGEFQGYEKLADGSSWRDFLTGMTMLAPAVAGVYGWAGQAAGGGGAATGAPGAAGSAASSITLPATAEVAAGVAPATWQSAMPALSNTLAVGGVGELAGGVAAAGGGAVGGGGAASSAPAYTTAAADSQLANAAGIGSGAGSAPAGVNLVNAGGAMSTGGGWMDSITSALGGGGGWGETLAKLGMAAYGAHEAGKNQQESVSREPWKPAQPLLMDLISQTGNLSKQYQQNPFSQAQQGAYGNSFGLLDAINGMAPGLMAGMQANASGANAYDRTNPRKQLTGANAQMQWNPQGLLGMLNFGGTNGR